MPRPPGRTRVRGRPRACASPSTVGVESNRPRGASGADVIASVPAVACSRTPLARERAARPAKVRASAAASGIGEAAVAADIRPKLPSESAAQSAAPETETRDRRPAETPTTASRDRSGRLDARGARSRRLGCAHDRGHLHRRLAVDAARPGLRRPGARAVDRRGAADDLESRGPSTRCTATSSAPATPTKGITFSVDRIHDGRSFSTRRTQAFQEGVPIFSMIASFQDEDPGLDHHDADADGLPGPGRSPRHRGAARRACTRCRSGSSPIGRSTFATSPRRSTCPVEGEQVPRQAVWMRSRRPLPDDPAIHRAALAYLSDLTIQESILRAHGVSWATPGLKVASLDHAMWWHRPGRVDEWMLYVQESPSARGGRGLATGRIYSRGRRRCSPASRRRSWCGCPRRRRAAELIGQRRFAYTIGSPTNGAHASRSAAPQRVGLPLAVSTSTTTAVARA